MAQRMIVYRYKNACASLCDVKCFRGFRYFEANELNVASMQQAITNSYSYSCVAITVRPPMMWWLFYDCEVSVDVKYTAATLTSIDIQLMGDLLFWWSLSLHFTLLLLSACNGLLALCMCVGDMCAFCYGASWQWQITQHAHGSSDDYTDQLLYMCIDSVHSTGLATPTSFCGRIISFGVPLRRVLVRSVTTNSR